MKPLALVITAFVLAGCASEPKWAPNAGRTYTQCTALSSCINTVRDVVSMNWINPTPKPGPQPYKVILMIELTDNAEVKEVAVSKPSGNEAFDQSALAAVRRSGNFRELLGLDTATYQKYFRKFGLDFNPSASKT